MLAILGEVGGQAWNPYSSKIKACCIDYIIGTRALVWDNAPLGWGWGWGVDSVGGGGGVRGLI